MTRGTLYLDGRIGSLSQSSQILAIDSIDHAHHFTGLPFRLLFVRGEVERAERLAGLTHVTVLASHAQPEGKAAHGVHQLALFDVVGQHLEVGEFVRDLRERLSRESSHWNGQPKRE
jgi:hypothetical protein